MRARALTTPDIRRPEWAAGLFALALGLLHLLVYAGSGMDLSAQLARASFASIAPFKPVDFAWYGGFHPYGYSLLAPFLMSSLGIATCGLIAATGSALLFARLVRHADRPLVGALSGAFFWAANVASGRVTFALGALAALAALVALPRLRVAAVLAVLTGLLSPVAAAFLGFVAAVLVLHRRRGGWTLGLATTLPVLCLAIAFPGGGVQPMSRGPATIGVVVGLALGILTEDRLVRTAALLYAPTVVALGLHHDPMGSNVLRLGTLVATPLLLATTARRPHSLLALVSAGFLVWQLYPLVGDLSSRTPPLAALTQALERAGSHRAEVLAGRDHHEAYEVAKDVPLARGWARQIDVRDNPLFYRPEPLRPDELLAWLRMNSIDHVAVPRSGKLDKGSVLEGALLRRPIPGLVREWSDSTWVLYRVEDPRPLVSMPAEVVSAGRVDMVLRSPEPAAVGLNIRWSRWLSLSGPGCLERAGTRVVVRFSAAGTVTVTSSLFPSGRCQIRSAG